jgi:hypothetical protein
VKPSTGDLVRVSNPNSHFEGSYGIVNRRDDSTGITWIVLTDKGDRGGEWAFETHVLEVLSRSPTGGEP